MPSLSTAAIRLAPVVDSNWCGLLNTYRFDFVADSATMTLLFADFISNFTLGTDGLLDNVSVTAHAVPAGVPEPDALALLALAGLACALRAIAVVDEHHNRLFACAIVRF